MTAAANDAKSRSGGVQSIERVFTLLELMADRGGTMGLSELSVESGLPLPTIHRLVRTLVDLGYLRQDAARRYTLGPKLVRLGESSSRLVGGWALPHLAGLVDDLGESANIAMLDGDRVVYVAQAPSRHSMRMFTEVGRRVLPHCTAVGKAMLAQLPEDEVLGILGRTGMPSHTEHTLTEPEAFLRQLVRCAHDGYALDEEEQEVGVRCVAVPVAHPSLRLAISVSGPAGRMSKALVERAVPLLQHAAGRLSLDLV
ncbi:MAG: IclR family transcriptional regulator [Nocardioidaceae bacterium]